MARAHGVAAGSPSPPRPSFPRLGAVAPASWALPCLALATVFIGGVAAALGPGPDASIFLTVGEAITRGDVPYRDIWDHKPPGVYLAAALAAVLPGPSWPWLVALTIAAATLAGIAIGHAAGRWAAVLGTGALALPAVALGGGMTETFAAAPAVAAILAADRGRWAVAGGLTALTLICSLQLVAVIPALLVLGGWRPRSLAAGLGGGVLVASPIVVWLAAAGALPAAWDQLVVYQRAYLALDRSADVARDGWRFALSLLPLAVLALPALPAVVGLRVARPIDRAALAWLIGALVLVAVGGRLFSHYAGFIVPPLAILAGAGIHRLGPLRRFAPAALLGATLVWALVSFAGMRSTAHAPEAVATAVRELTDPGDRIVVWGFEARTYSAAERRPAGRYVYHVALVTPGYSTREMIDAWIAELRSDPPELLVDAEADHPHWPEDADFFRPPPPGTAGGRDLDLLEPLRAFAAERYELVAEVEGRKLYRLR